MMKMLVSGRNAPYHGIGSQYPPRVIRIYGRWKRMVSRMRKSNKWAYGPIELVIPPLAPTDIGTVGCRFEGATFDSRVGTEICLLILDEPGYARRFADTRPFNLLSTQGLVRTTNGIVAYIVWTVAAGSAAETRTEQFLNPRHAEAIELVSAAEQQSHLKVLIVDNREGRVDGWFELENKFGFDRFSALMAKSIGQGSRGDFQAAMEEVVANYSTADLLGL